MRSRVWLPLPDTPRERRTGEPGGFVVGEPPGRWNVGEVFFTGSGAFFRILAIDGPPEGDVPEAESWDGVWTVAPVSTAG